MAISASGLDVWLGKKQVLNGVDFAAHAGQVTMVVGPNGSGKTTLLRALTGDLNHGGEVHMNGHDIAGMDTARLARMRAVLAQHTRLAFPFSVGEVVEMGLRAGDGAILEPDRRMARVRAALETVDLGEFGNRLCQELSGGEQQRVHLARVLCQIWEPVGEGSPKWLFLDEPVSSLDIRHQLQVMTVARDYARRGGGVVAVMHDLNLAAMFGDRIVAMSGGRVAKAGTPEEVLTTRMLADVFNCPLKVGAVPPGGRFVLPQSAMAD